MGVQLLMMVALTSAMVPAKVLTLEQALQTARHNHPQIGQAQGTADAQYARADEARAPLLPQLTLVAGYQRTSANYAPRPGSVPASLNTGTTATSFDSFNYWTGTLSLSQYIWDFGQTTKRWRSAQALGDSLEATAHATEQQVVAAVRTAYFNARAQLALIGVARENLANLERHLKQIEGFVLAGTRPKIDLAQARADRAQGKVQLITAVNGYAIAKAQLNAAIGDTTSTDYDVQDESLPVIAGEDGDLAALMREAMDARPELAAEAKLVRGYELLVSAAKGAYGPTITAGLNLSEGGVDLSNLAWNWSASVNLTWPLFQGLLTRSQIKEARANVNLYKAQNAQLINQVRVEVEQAQLQVQAAKETLVAVGEALFNSQERLRLAEGRYQSGVGSIIELGDAQIAAATAGAQKVQAEYNVSTARAALLKAVGHSS